MSDLVALVKKPRTQTAIDSLRAEGVYDTTRSVVSHDDRYVAVPVAEAPSETTVDSVRELDLPKRSRGLESILSGRGVSEELIEAAPSSWATLGSVVLVDFGDVSAEGTVDAEGRETIGEALLELHGNADTVLARGGISGTQRDPSAAVVAGIGDTETIHVEHGTKYALDLSKAMFSPGNKAERARMGNVVDTGERVFDMFAGIGYFTLPMARAGATVTAAEIDPESYRLLVESARLNGVAENIRAVLGDCRTIETTADRIVMGYYEAHEYLDTALDSLEEGGTVHLHEATPEARFPERPVERLCAAAADTDRTVERLDSRIVKSHSEGVVHGVVDAELGSV